MGFIMPPLDIRVIRVTYLSRGFETHHILV